MRQPSRENRGAGGEGDEPEKLALPPGWTPHNLAPVAWYFATADDFVSEPNDLHWYDHRPERRLTGMHFRQTFPPGMPQLTPAPWAGNHQTVRFNGGQLMTADPWSESPTGPNVGFTLLAVMRARVAEAPVLPDAGVAAWWGLAGDAVWASVRVMDGLTLLDFTRMDDAITTQMHTGNQDLGTDPHVVAWRFSPGTETLTLTVDGVNFASSRQPA